MDKIRFVNLCSRGWSIPVLKTLASGVSARVSPVASSLAASRTAIGDTFQHLATLGLLERNPGHGHPLRPEFQLTPMGRVAADWAIEFAEHMRSDQDWGLVRRSWTLPVLRELEDARRYAQLRSTLQPITDRALSLTLKQLVSADWVARDVSAISTPPIVLYDVATRAGHLMPSLIRSRDVFAG